MKKLLGLILVVTLLPKLVLAFPSGYVTQKVYDIKTAKDTNTTNIATNVTAIALNTNAVSNNGSGTASAFFIAKKTGVYILDTADTSVLDGTTVNTPLVIPAGAVITKVTAYVDTAITASGSNTLALGCITASDLLPETAFASKARYSVTAGTPIGGNYAASVTASQGCTVAYQISASDPGYTAGKITFFIDYFLGVSGI